MTCPVPNRDECTDASACPLCSSPYEAVRRATTDRDRMRAALALTDEQFLDAYLDGLLTDEQYARYRAIRTHPSTRGAVL